MISISLIWIHFISDFILQFDKMAINKSRSIKYLILHCFLYTIPFLIFGWKFAVLNGCLHFLVDLIASKLTTYLYTIKKRHWFFVTIGFDQAVHLTCLFLSAYYFL